METFNANAIHVILFKSEHYVTPNTEFMHFSCALGLFVPNILQRSSYKSEMENIACGCRRGY